MVSFLSFTTFEALSLCSSLKSDGRFYILKGTVLVTLNFWRSLKMIMLTRLYIPSTVSLLGVLTLLLSASQDQLQQWQGLSFVYNAAKVRVRKIGRFNEANKHAWLLEWTKFLLYFDCLSSHETSVRRPKFYEGLEFSWSRVYPSLFTCTAVAVE